MLASDYAEASNKPLISSYYPALRDVAGGKQTCAVVLSEVLYWTNWSLGRAGIRVERGQDGSIMDMEERAGFFYRAEVEWRVKSGLSRCELRTARRRLRDEGLIQESDRGHSPRTKHYRATPKALQLALDLHIPIQCVQSEGVMPSPAHVQANRTRRANREAEGATAKLDLSIDSTHVDPPVEKAAESVEMSLDSAAIAAPMPVVAAAEPPEHPLIARMREVGVTHHMAQGLLHQYGETVCAEQLDALPHRKRKHDRAGMLVSSIRQNWSAPSSPRPDARKADSATKTPVSSSGSTASKSQQGPVCSEQPGKRAFEQLSAEEQRAVMEEARAAVAARSADARRRIESGRVSPLVDSWIEAESWKLALGGQEVGSGATGEERGPP